MTEFIITELGVFIALLLLSLQFKKAAKSKFGIDIGYRTKRSIKNDESWKFANSLCSKYTILSAFVILIIGLFVVFLVNIEIIGYSEDLMALIMVKLAISSSIQRFIVENKLKKYQANSEQ